MSPILDADLPWLFCYGTLCQDDQWQALGGDSKTPSVSASLPNFRRFDIPGVAYPGIAPQQSSHVPGILRQVPVALWTALDEYEGEEYTRAQVTVICDAKAYIVWTYLWRPQIQIELLADHPDWVPWLSAQFFEQWHHLRPESLLSEWETRIYAQCERGGLNTILVGVLHGKPIASARLRDNDMGIRPELNPWLAGVWTLPQLRNCGIGPQLISAVEVDARQHGFSQLFLWTPDRMAFYLRQGYQIREQTRYLDCNATVMEKSLLSIHP